MKFVRELNTLPVARLLLTILAGWAGIALSQRLLPWLAERLSGRNRLYLLATVPVLRLLILIAISAAVIAMTVEPSVENLVAYLGALGLALGYGLKDYVSSIVAGIVTLYEMPYGPGDWVEIGGVYGEVKSIGMRTVVILTSDDTMVSVPHSFIWGGPVHNSNYGSENLMCITEFLLDPCHDSGAAIRALEDTALSSAYLRHTMPVLVSVEESPFGTRYKIKAYPVDPRDQFKFKTDLTVRGRHAIAAAGIALSRPLATGSAGA